jgi:putative endonuclease
MDHVHDLSSGRPYAARRTREDTRRSLGSAGEDQAARHLRALGYELIARNVRTRRGEIDLIARDGSALVFAEVKTRRVGARQKTLRADQAPLCGLGPAQRARLRRLAASWLAETRRSRPATRTIRFDAIGVTIDTRGALRRLDHIEAAW